MRSILNKKKTKLNIKLLINSVKNILTRLFHCNLYEIVFILLYFYNIYIIINNDRHDNDYTYRVY